MEKEVEIARQIIVEEIEKIRGRSKDNLPLFHRNLLRKKEKMMLVI